MTARRSSAKRASQAVVGLAVVLAASACASSNDSLGTGSAGAPAQPAASAQARPVAQLGQLRLAALGTVAQRRAGEQIYFHTAQDPIQACMSKAGFTYVVPAFQDIYAGFTDQMLADAPEGGGWLTSTGTTGFGLAARTDAQRSGMNSTAADQQAAPAIGSYETLSTADQARYNTTVTACQQSAPNYTQTNFPAGAEDLNSALTTLQNGVLRDPEAARITKGYQSCMASGGFVAASPDKLLEALAFPNTDPSTPAWQQAARQADTAAARDQQCRGPLLTVADRLLSSKLPTWRNQHATQMQHVQTGWQAIEAKAAQYR